MTTFSLPSQSSMLKLPSFFLKPLSRLVFRLFLHQPRSQVLTPTRRETLSLSLSLVPSGRVKENPGNEVVSTRTSPGKKRCGFKNVRIRVDGTKEPKEREMKKWEQNLTWFACSFLLSRCPLPVTRCTFLTVVASDSITNNKHCITHIRVSIMSHCFTLCLTNSLLSSQTIHLEFSTRRK